MPDPFGDLRFGADQKPLHTPAAIFSPGFDPTFGA